ncbi:MAG: Tim44 domain-containing protein [Burkholderiales bacterium]|nr:Tim44 domain-containing protein [Burkholderiales bacterium]
MKLWTFLLAALLAAASVDADAARRLGGGQSTGRQSSNVTQREAGTAPTQAAPAQQTQRSAAPPAAAAPPARSGFGGMLAGLAAGLGLAWLAHTLGFGEAFATILMVALLALLVMGVIGFVMRSRRSSPAAPGGYAFQAAGHTPDAPIPPRQYNPDKVGNDASARPWERASMAFEPAKVAQHQPGGLGIGSALAGPQGWSVPAGFDTEGFLKAAKANFVTLQEAWDRGDVATLRSMMTDEMLTGIRRQLAEREAQPAGYRTEVVMLEAQLLGIEELAGEYMASVEFSGMIREEPSSGPAPFREVWNMTKPRSGASGWLVAGVQALQ